jgi:hypothetical protein
MLDLFNPLRTFQGMKIVISPDYPKMTLSEELIPGIVPWPPGFKKEMDDWMLSFFGTANLLKDDIVIYTSNTIYTNPRSYVKLKNSLP